MEKKQESKISETYTVVNNFDEILPPDFEDVNPETICIIKFHAGPMYQYNKKQLSYLKSLSSMVEMEESPKLGIIYRGCKTYGHTSVGFDLMYAYINEVIKRGEEDPLAKIDPSVGLSKNKSVDQIIGIDYKIINVYIDRGITPLMTPEDVMVHKFDNIYNSILTSFYFGVDTLYNKLCMLWALLMRQTPEGLFDIYMDKVLKKYE